MEHQNYAGEYLTFRLASEEYAVNILTVQEIRTCTDKITKLVGTPAYVKGIMDLRGIIVPVMDARIKFGLPETTATQENVVIVISTENNTFGMRVDGVNDVVKLLAEDIKDSLTDSDSFVTGICTVKAEPHDRTILITSAASLY